METLDHLVLWWHWIVLGIVLAVVEMLTATFIVVWFAFGAIVVGTIDYFYHLQFSTALFLWGIVSFTSLFVYWKWFRKVEKSLSVGQSEGEYVGIEGVVVEKLGEGRYLARFDLPVLGDREWVVESDHDRSLDVGQRIVVDKVYGQIIKVKSV